jgi:hypothetical protein
LRPAPVIEHAVLPFAVGDRVCDVRGEEAMVMGIDTKANHGMRSVHVRFDDGREINREINVAACAHGLRRVERPKG